MKLLYSLGAVASMAMVAAGVFMLAKHGLSARGISSLLAASGAAFCLSITLYAFHLRHRIEALEKAAHPPTRPEA